MLPSDNFKWPSVIINQKQWLIDLQRKVRNFALFSIQNWCILRESEGADRSILDKRNYDSNNTVFPKWFSLHIEFYQWCINWGIKSLFMRYWTCDRVSRVQLPVHFFTIFSLNSEVVRKNTYRNDITAIKKVKNWSTWRDVYLYDKKISTMREISSDKI